MTETPEVHDDAQLLDELLSEAPVLTDRKGNELHVKSLSAKLIAHWTGLSLQTISDYRTGKLNIPIRFWRRILEHWFDARIVALLIPEAYTYEIVPLPMTPPETGPDWFREAVSDMADYHDSAKYLAEIIADGRVDEADAESVQRYDSAYLRHRHTEATLHRSILVAFNRSVALKEAGR